MKKQCDILQALPCLLKSVNDNFTTMFTSPVVERDKARGRRREKERDVYSRFSLAMQDQAHKISSAVHTVTRMN